MQWAKSRGATWYDLWGIPDELGQLAIASGSDHDGCFPADVLPVNVQAMPREDLWGVFRFKQGFGGSILRDIGAWEMALKPYGRQLYAVGIKVREQRSLLRRRSANNGANLQAVDIIRVSQALEWQEVLNQLPAPHVLQSWEWGAVKSHTGWHAEHLVVKQEDEVIGACQFLSREVSDKLPFRIAYVPKGPVIDWSKTDQVNMVLDALEQHARMRKCIFLKIDPDVRAGRADGVVLVAKLRRRGWRYSDDQIQFKNTAYTPLWDDDRLLSSMKSKWRYNIRLSSRRGIEIQQGTADDLAAFYEMYSETGQRDGFLVRPYAYYEAAWKTFLCAQDQEANPAGGALLLATHADEEKPVAGLFLLRYGERTWYFYGASTERRRRDMPNHLLQWEAMRWARDNGSALYDWWGAPSDLSDPSDPMQGVWKFKEGFGACFQEHVGAWDFVLNPLLYSVYNQVIPRALELMKRRRATNQD